MLNILNIIIVYLLHINISYSAESLDAICSKTVKEITRLETHKNNLKKEFKKIESETEKMSLLDEITMDINKIIDAQIKFAKIYHYLNCSNYSKK